MVKAPALASFIALALLLTVPCIATWLAGDHEKSDSLSEFLAAGRKALSAGEYRKAKRSFSKAEELSKGTSPNALLGLATAYLRLGDLPNAQRYGERALSRVKAPADRAIAENLLGTILYEEALGRKRRNQEEEGELAGAEAYFRRALDLSKGELSAAWKNLSFVLERQHRFMEAMKAEEEYLEREPEDQLSRSRLCWLEYLAQTDAPANERLRRELASASGAKKPPLEAEGDVLVPKKFVHPVFEVGDNVSPPKKLRYPSANYTEAARKERVQGVVMLQAVINRRGFVRNVKVLKGLPLGLTEEAVRAVCHYRFEPATLEGSPVAVVYSLTFSFSLGDRK